MRARPSSRPSQKSALERYYDTSPLTCAQANSSRMVSARRHVIENINSSIKRFRFLSNRVQLDYINSGYCLAASKFICGLLNFRFKTGRSRVLDMNSKAILPNLERAYLMRLDEGRHASNRENIMFSCVEPYFDELHDFRKINSRSGQNIWSKIRFENKENLMFPPVSFDSIPDDVYSNLEGNHVFWFSFGNFSLKRSLSYLNTEEYERDFFECQYLSRQSDLYNRMVSKIGGSKHLHIIRCRVPSLHKQGHFNSGGYKCLIAYFSVSNYSSTNPSDLTLVGNQPCTNIDKQDFYFKSTIKGWWCSCKSGMRSLGACTHITSCLVGFGRPDNYRKKRYLLLDHRIFQ